MEAFLLRAITCASNRKQSYQTRTQKLSPLTSF